MPSTLLSMADSAVPFIDLTTVGQDATATARCVVEQVAGRLEARAPR